MGEDLTEAELDTLKAIAETTGIDVDLDDQHVSKLEQLGYVEVRQNGVILNGKGRSKLKTAGRAVP